MKTIRQAAVDLRIAQRAYLADRGNDALGQAVAQAAADLDEALAFPELTPDTVRAKLEAVVTVVGEAWDAGSIEGREGFLGSIPAATQVLFEALPSLAGLTPDSIGVQEAWEAAGGNPGIQATRPELIETLKLLDEVSDDADQATRPAGAMRPVAWRAQWNGDDSDLNATLFASDESELDDEHDWEPLFAGRAPDPLFVHVAWRNQISDQWVYFPSTYDPRNAHDNGKPYEKVYVLASFDVLVPRLEQQLSAAQAIVGNPMITILGQEVANALAFLNARRPSPELLQRLAFVRDAIKPIGALEGMSTTIQQAIDTLSAGPTDAKGNP